MLSLLPVVVGACAQSHLQDHVPGVETGALQFLPSAQGELTVIRVLDDSSPSRTLGPSCEQALREAARSSRPPAILTDKSMWMTCTLGENPK